MNKAGLIKIIVLIVALVNQSLVMSGYSPLPFDDAQVENFVSTAFTIVASLIAWKSNNFDKKE
jgi:SPP1 family holin